MLVSGEVMVSASTAALIADGSKVIVRGLKALVDSRRDVGCGMFLVLAGRNRWKGDGLG